MTETLETRSMQRDRGIRLRCSLAASAGFALLIVGSNIPAPILPIYRDDLQLSTFTVTALFAVYLAALVATFTTVARTTLAGKAAVVLPVSLGIGMIADVALWAGHDAVAWLFAGRMLTGLAAGLGTGATATIAVAMRGERGRAIAATGTLAGSFLGLVGAAVVAEFLPGPTTTVYLCHIALVAIALGLLIVALVSARRVLKVELRGAAPSDATIDRDLGTLEVTGVPAVAVQDTRRLRWAGYGLGIAGWAIGGIVVGLLPTVVADELGSPSIIVTALAPIVLLGAACLSPYVFRSMRAEAAVVVIAVAAVLCLVGVWLGNLGLILTCCVLWGVGQGFAYACGLRIVTAGLGPVDQGRVASRYASICYGFTGVLAVTTGAVATAWGSVGGMVLQAVVFVTLCTSVAVLGHRRWPAGV
ncbi:MFS transporter [Gordonia rhizosphera]|uniref:Putative major facilitator superfamily transporter n=1 Tax=Gordonia rhizosphera NBRC 16068 TaxID=1108045 RepID=K6WP19_9ACTN|nr:MFS transporter [Gordonia rhizosphera]GAB88279.1 putative major facilitator superfamily transporter [Gordonia rhizosphera NBRC 16068]